MSNKNILVINCGSSSVKFSVIEPNSGDLLLSGLAERLGDNEACITFKHDGEKSTVGLCDKKDHSEAIRALVEKLNALALTNTISAVGHRIVHGGERYAAPCIVDQTVANAIADLAKLAPLHNRANLTGIEVCQNIFSDLPQTAVFDTAFHQTMPKTAFLYGLPYELYQEHAIRRYGFHGTSHYFVSRQAAEFANKSVDQLNVISAHLGNGCSVCAIKNGQSVDTSLGLTPLEGVMMGTRSGDVDPGVIFHMVDQLGYSIGEINDIFNKQSGLLGVSQLSNDCRTIEEAVDKGNEQAALALDMFCYRIAKSIASYCAALPSLDGVIFTGGIGENSALVRSKILKQLHLIGVQLDESRNNDTCFGKSGRITSDQGVAAWVIPTNEEWVIAKQTYQLLQE
ncbi:acetate/propionate family kinase [Thalassotalea agarivorans]|uniref:Acetate kinase n=1 Tax=Thalassotalea agarivorans TaxID=349064 RepID=A0A1I0DIM9_THASX|nr:acetate kinase [Thalassotalea agarivorans]SET32294.1 acetate kinase [Thalassotalea agarivorans]